MSRLLVTGGTGFVGRRTVPLLVRRGHDVVGLARSDTAVAELATLGADAVRGDLDDLDSLIAAFCDAQADALVNIASLGFGHGPDIVRAAEAAGLKRCVFISTTAIFTKLNAQTKKVRVAAEEAIVRSDLDATILRPTMIYGAPDDRNLARLLEAIRRYPVLPLVGGGDRLQQPVHVDDVAAAIVSVLDHPLTIGRSYDIAGPDPLPFKAMIDEAASAAGARIVTVPVPLAPVVLLAKSYERLSPRPRLRSEQFERLAEDKAFDIAAARDDFGFAPRSFADGIAAEVAELSSRPPSTRRAGRFPAPGRMLRTIRHLSPTQMWSRMRLRALRRAVMLWPGLLESRWTLPSATDEPGWPGTFRPLDADRFASPQHAAEIERSEISVLNRRVPLDGDWEGLPLPQLWRYHVHYWDWAWHVVAHRPQKEASDILDRLYAAWSASTRFGRLDGWSPYVVALRLWTWCGLHGRLHTDSTMRSSVAAEVRRHAGFLRANLETDVGGNHLLKNIKALVGAAIFLHDDGLVQEYLDRLDEQLPIQVLDDGGHYELSPSYHAQVLGDLIDVRELLHGSGRPTPVRLDDAIHAMRAWLGALVGPDGGVPIFNDGHSIGTDELARLAVSSPGCLGLETLAASGYVVSRPRDDVQIAIDVGHPCPRELPAHAHADCLSFELVIGAHRLVVDAGSSEYGATARRRFERSTAAHNTLEIDGADQTEVWGAFRAGRRARPTLVESTDVGGLHIVEAEHDGYRSLPGRPIHRRRFEIATNGMTITDRVTGSGTHHMVSRLRLAGSFRPSDDPCEATVVAGSAQLRVIGPQPLAIHADETYAREFGKLRPAVVVAVALHDVVPAEICWRLEWS